MLEGASPAHRPFLRQAALATLKAIPPRVSRRLLPEAELYLVGISFVSPVKMRALNREYRGKDRPTDVLAFSRIEHGSFPGVQCDVGDVVICLAVARLQAKEYGGKLKEELQRLVVHGVLHLFGYDHEKSPWNEKIMFALQNEILKRLGVAKT